MKIIDHEPQFWFLFEEQSELYFNVSCNHSFTGYDFSLQLNEAEKGEYIKKGRDYLNWLGEDIHNSAPLLEGTRYRQRKALDEIEARINIAITQWQKSSDEELRV